MTSKYFVPAILTLTISGLAITLIAIVIARSPYTHGNLSAKGYSRTTVAYVGQQYQFEGIGLKNPSLAGGSDPATDGKMLFLSSGCATCHGLDAQGGAVGPRIAGSAASKVLQRVRSPRGGMPAYPASVLSDDQVKQIAAFLASLTSSSKQ